MVTQSTEQLIEQTESNDKLSDEVVDIDTHPENEFNESIEPTTEPSQEFQQEEANKELQNEKQDIKAEKKRVRLNADVFVLKYSATRKYFKDKGCSLNGAKNFMLLDDEIKKYFDVVMGRLKKMNRMGLVGGVL